MKYLYHITTPENMKNILSEGKIKPKIGENSVLQIEHTPRIYLCEYKDLPYWKQLLGTHNTLRLPLEDLETHNLKKRTYAGYEEYYTTKTIQSKQLKPVYCGHPTTESNKHLCLEYVWTLGNLCTLYARYYHNQKSIELPNLIEYTENILSILSRLNYTALTKQDYQETINELIDSCAYTFADYYNNTNKRLWEQLIYYPKDEATDCRQKLHTFIQTNLKPILYINTGGWCE